jgi:hypothetical protein
MKGSEAFRTAALEHGWSLASDKHVDIALQKYAELLASNGDSIVTARNGVYGEAWRRGYNLKDSNTLFRARQSLEGWKNLVPDNSKDPCPWHACVLVIDDLLQHGGLIEGEAASCAALQFDSYCRPSTAAGLGTHNVVLPPSGSSSQYQRTALILAPKELEKTTKTGNFDDSLLLGTVNPNRSWAASLAAQLKRNAEQAQRLSLFPNLNLHRYERCIREAGKRTGLGKLQLSPHLFRHGGPSVDIFEGRITLDGVAKRGQWAGTLGVKRYEKHARLLKVLNSMSVSQREKAEKLIPTIGRQLMNRALR